jgi:hypothetical protein
MAKKKKGKKIKKSKLFKKLKPYLSDKRVLWSIVGAVGVGVALGAVFGTDKGREIVDKIALTAKELVNDGNMNKNHTVAKKQKA